MNSIIIPLSIEIFDGKEQEVLQKIFKEYMEIKEFLIFDLPFDTVTAEINHSGKKIGSYNFATEQLTIFME